MRTSRALALLALVAGCAGESLADDTPAVGGTGGAVAKPMGGSGGSSGLHRGGSNSAGTSAGRAADANGGAAGAGEAGAPNGGDAPARGGSNGAGAQGGTSTDAGDSGSAGLGGEAGWAGEPLCAASPATPEDACDFPESLGGGDLADQCGVTPGAWYSLGASDLSIWPARVESATTGGLGEGYSPVLMDRDGNPVVMIGCTAHVWSGDGWEVLPAPEVQDSLAGCNFALNDNGELFVAYANSLGPTGIDDQLEYELYAARWENGAWAQLGAERIAKVCGSAYGGFAFDADGALTVTWSDTCDNVDTSYFSAKRFDPDGGEWRSWLFNSRDSIETWGDVIFTLGDGAPLLTEWEPWYGSFRALELDGEHWVDIASGPLARTMRRDEQWPASYGVVRDSTGRLVIYRTTPEDLKLFRRSGKDWEEVAPTDEVLETLPPAVRLRVFNDGVVGEDHEVYLQRLEGCGWRGLSASDRGGGISNSSYYSNREAVAASAERVCVSWTEDLGSYRVMLRCHDLPSAGD